MPSQKQEFSFPGQTTDQLLLAAYGTFLALGWTPKFAGPHAVIGYTPRSWNKYDDEILVEATDETMSVTSSLIHNESFDMMGKNKKHINDFMTAFEKVRSSGTKPEWAAAIENLRSQTIETVTAESKQAEEINKVMKLAGSNLYATYGIIAINVIVFILMVINGAGIIEPNNEEVYTRWGSNNAALTMNGDWWRLITNIFIHFGIIHLAMNTYALYIGGVYLEPMLGKATYIGTYLCTGVIASMASLWWHKEGVNSAGASGAIFGLYGVFLALLFTNLIPKRMRIALLQSIGIFVVFNLVYGMKSGIDNAAHIGGLLSGMIIGFIFYLELSGKIKISKPAITLFVAGLTVIGTWYFLNNFKSDAGKLKQLLNEFSKTEELALRSEQVSNISAAGFKKRLQDTTLPSWNRNLEILNEMDAIKSSTTFHAYLQKLRNYIQLRIEETELLIKAREVSGTYDKEIEDVRKRIAEVLNTINN